MSLRRGAPVTAQRPVFFFFFEVIAIINPIFNNKIITEISPLGDFYPAEAYHQNYYNQNNSAGYCNAVITPKVNNLRKMYADKLKENA